MSLFANTVPSQPQLRNSPMPVPNPKPQKACTYHPWPYSINGSASCPPKEIEAHKLKLASTLKLENRKVFSCMIWIPRLFFPFHKA